MRVAILTALWQRPILSQLFLTYYQAMKTRFEDRFELYLLAVGSKGEVSKNLANNYNWSYVEAPNQTLSDKWRAGAQQLQALNLDATVILGSDDLGSHSLVRR